MKPKTSPQPTAEKPLEKRGRGRPPKHDYSWFGEFKERLLACDDPLEIAILAQKVAVRAMIAQAEGKGAREHNQEIRAFLRIALAAIPKEGIVGAEQVVRQAALPRKPTARVAAKPQKRKHKNMPLRAG